MTAPPKAKSSSAEDLERANVAPPGAKEGRCGACCRRILTFLFSTVGLTCLTVAYSALGGYIFMVLESPSSPIRIPEPVTQLPFVTAEAVKREVDDSLERHLHWLWNVTEEFNVLQRDDWMKMAKDVLRNYTSDVHASLGRREGTKSNVTEKVEDNQWSYPLALLYAITVVTTIGYGHITPKTTEGMIVTMVYAVIGIPLTLLTIAHLGRIMATAVRFLYLCCCSLCRGCCRRASKRPARATDSIVTREATPCVDSLKQEADGASTAAEEPEEQRRKKKKLAEVQVPISLTVMILVAYIAIGALLFSIWEDWSPVEASYFCFITISTIGFGDYVPGIRFDERESQEKLLCCAVYLLLGLSFLAMCFDLIQAEVLHKCRRLGTCIGLVQPKDIH